MLSPPRPIPNSQAVDGAGCPGFELLGFELLGFELLGFELPSSMMTMVDAAATPTNPMARLTFAAV